MCQQKTIETLSDFCYKINTNANANQMEGRRKSREHFYAFTLPKNGATITWDLRESSPQDRLVLKQILLGHQAKEGEFNVVQAEIMREESSTKIDVAVLKAGECRMSLSTLEFSDVPVNFTLIEGNGPVYLLGNQVPGESFEDNIDEDFDIEDVYGD